MGSRVHECVPHIRQLTIFCPFCKARGQLHIAEMHVNFLSLFRRRPQLPTMLGQFVHTLPLFR